MGKYQAQEFKAIVQCMVYNIEIFSFPPSKLVSSHARPVETLPTKSVEHV